MSQTFVAELVAHLARSLVDRPELVVVRAIEETGHLLIELKVAPSDLGKVIGRRGSTARALRTVVASVAARIRRRVVVNIVED
ncbi:MAG: KH domain-containing protein [Myxococcales bacterium]|nr:KH domain-containing protein [Myxococcales bacterium]